MKKLSTIYYFTQMWDIKLKLIDTDNSVVVTRGKEVGGKSDGGRGKYMVMGDDLTLSGRHTMQYEDHV